MSRRLAWRDAVVAGYMLLVAGLFMGQAIVTRSTIGQYPSDGTRIMYVMREYLMGAIHNQRLPEWNPFIQFGAPYVADIQWATFYPLNLLFTNLPGDLAYNLFIGLHLALAGFFMYLLARGWDLSRPSAIVAGTVFMLNGRMVVEASGGWITVLSSVAWLPLVLLLFDRTLTSRRYALWGGLTTLAVAVDVLAGHPQHTFFTVTALVALAVWRGLDWTAAGRRYGVAPLLAALAILAVSAGMAAIQLAPTYEAMTLSTRHVEWKLFWPPPPIEGSYNPLRLATWLAPDVYGNAVSLRPAATDWLSLALHELHSHEFTAYIGVLPLLLALFSLTVWRANGRVRFLWALAAVGFLFALGTWTPIYGLVYAAVPPFRVFRVPARFLVLVIFSCSLLAGFGADALLADAKNRARAWSTSIFVLAAALLAAVAVALAVRAPVLAFGHRLASPLFATRPSGQLLSADGREHLVTAAYGLTLYSVGVAAVLLALSAEVFRRIGQRQAPAGALAGAIVAIVCLDLGVHAAKYATAEPITMWFARSAPVIEAIRTTSPADREYTLEHGVTPDPVRPNDNIFIHEQLHTAGGYESFELATYRPLRDLLDADLRRGSSYIADVFGIRFLASDVPLAAAGFQRIALTDTATLYQNPSATSRAYVAGLARTIADPSAALEALGRRGVRPGGEVLVETTGSIVPGAVGSAGRAAIVLDTPERIQMDVSADRDGYLVLNDTYYPGWTATVDDRAEPILRANGHVRAVRVAGGRHDVTMRFASPAIAQGKRVSLIILSATALLMAVGIVLGR